MATPHISAEPGDIAPLVLMPGDPRRARRIAADFLQDARLVTEVRGIEGYTGTYAGIPMSVVASGMGVPSMSIYATELFRFYGVDRIVRVGTAGAFPAHITVGDIVIASAAHTDSQISNLLVPGVTLSLVPSPQLLVAAVGTAGADAHVGPVLCSDYFYLERPDTLDALQRLGTLAVEMESAGLYAVAATEQRKALTILTISDHIRTGQSLTAAERETSYGRMVDIAAKTLVANL